VTAATTYAGIRILDLTKNIAGPYGTMVLADLGADVIKVEDPDRGDDTRHFAPHWQGESVSFLAMNRNKRSIAVDLKSDEGREQVLALAETADVLVESFRPGVVERLGLDPAAVRARNPRIITVSIAAFGSGALGRDLPGYDPLVQAFTGIMAATGHPGSEPVRVAPSLVDLSTGMWAAMAIMAALARRHDSPQGEHIEVALVDSALNLMCHQVIGVLATGESPPRCGSGSPLSAPYEVFATGDEPIMIAAGNDALFRRLCDALDDPDLLADPRFADVGARVAARDALHERLEAHLVRARSAHWLDVLTRAGVPVGPVQTLADALAHPVTAERDLLRDVDGLPRIPALQLLRTPLDDGSAPMREPPLLGEHTAEVLAELATRAGRP
jgi:crotonobetainyl-CoA:carnitine CoA-transferase CaiB-like acyl-CoA transferase